MKSNAVKILLLSFIMIGISLPVAIIIQNNAGGEALWSSRDAGWIGGIGGSAVGILGGVIGSLSACYRWKWAFHTQFALLLIMANIGLSLLVFGSIFIFSNQPYEVYYPLLLGGGLMTILGFSMLHLPYTRRTMIEKQKMQALDANG